MGRNGVISEGRGGGGGGGGVQGDNNYAKGAVPKQLGRSIGLDGGENNPLEVEVQVRYWTRSRKIHPPPGIGVI